MSERRIGIIGGSGLYGMEGLQGTRPIRVETPFGDPSDAILTGDLDGRPVAFLPRHGQGHRIAPGKINHRANIFALKTLGVEWIISISAVGSMKEAIAPGHMVIPDQFIDRTTRRESSFFGEGFVVHVAIADPTCADLGSVLATAGETVGATVHRGGTYVCIEGPQFSTRAESALYRSWGVDVIGMTNMPEAKLAREAEICYATVALASDYDCWHPDHGDVSVDAVLDTLRKNVDIARGVIREAVRSVPEERGCFCATALKMAMITDRSVIPAAMRKDLDPLIGKYFPEKPRKGLRLTAYTDGASRGNPGPAGIGALILDGDGDTLQEIAEGIGKATNNEAEYRAILAAARFAELMKASHLGIRTDSELVARQLQGRYRVKSPKLAPLYQEVRALLDTFPSWEIESVPRKENKAADRLANRGIDEGS
jgi:5'-methylthioadenosine phosphorylase